MDTGLVAVQADEGTNDKAGGKQADPQAGSPAAATRAIVIGMFKILVTFADSSSVARLCSRRGIFMCGRHCGGVGVIWSVHTQIVRSNGGGKVADK